MKHLKQFLDHAFSDVPDYLRLKKLPFPEVVLEKHPSRNGSLYRLHIEVRRTDGSGALRSAVFDVIPFGGSTTHWRPVGFLSGNIASYSAAKSPFREPVLQSEWHSDGLSRNPFFSHFDASLNHIGILKQKHIAELRGVSLKPGDPQPASQSIRV